MKHQKWFSDKLFDLASEVQEGCIVELGTEHGTGTILLARGARAGYGAQVYTVDDYTAKKGWVGELYGPGDLKIFKYKIKMARVSIILIKKSFHEAAHHWHQPIGMWYWDPGMKNRFWQDWLDWNKHIVRGGIAVVKDAAHGDLGATAVMNTINDSGIFERESFRDGVTVLRRV